MQAKQIDLAIAELLDWAGIRPASYCVECGDYVECVDHYDGIPPGGVFHEYLPRWASNASTQLILCRQKGWRIAYHPTDTLNIAVVRTGKQEFGGSHPDSIEMAGAFALHRALREEKI